MDSVNNIGSRRRAAGNHYVAEEQALDQIAKEAESRLAARRQARAEAREIRMRELERQQKEMEENADRQFEATNNSANDALAVRMNAARTSSTAGSSTGAPVAPTSGRNVLSSASSFQSSRRGSEDSLDENGGLTLTYRDLRQELKELEEKFKKAMVQNAQLDNEKAALTYQVELYKDKLQDSEEAYFLLQKEHRDQHRQFEDLKREFTKSQQELRYHKYLLEERDKLIQEHGLVMVGEPEDDEDGNAFAEDKSTSLKSQSTPSKALVSQDVASLLEKAGEGSLDVRVRRLVEEKKELTDQLRRLKLDLEEERSKSMFKERSSSISAPMSPNGPVGDLSDYQKEAINKQINEYKIKLQKADQEIATLQATNARLETQLTRFRTAAETAEKAEDELKAEKRKLQRELREYQTKFEELETSHNHLQRRLEKLKAAKSALLKDI